MKPRWHESDPERPEPSQALLVEILRCASDFYGFDAGIIYVADHNARTMRCAAFIGCDGLPIDPAKFVYRFDERSAATRVLNKQGFFSLNPRRDPEVNKEGLRAFQIKGPLVALPLVVTDRVLGALVMWSREGEVPSKVHASSLRPFAFLAATCIAPWEAGRSEGQLAAALANIQQGTKRLRASLRDRRYIRLIFIGILAAGFERVRIFRFKRDRAGHGVFVCEASRDVGGDDRCRGVTIDPATNAYAADIVASYVANPGAREYDPDGATRGPDPDGERLGKNPAQPWAAVPLVVHRHLYGQISADHGRAYRDITPESLEYLTLVGDFVARAIENDHQRAAQLKTQKRLADSESLYRSLVEELPQCVLRKNLDGEFTYVNGSFCQLLGRSWQEIRGRTDRDFYAPKLAEAYQADDRLVIETGRRHERIEAHHAPTRSPFQVHVIKTPIRTSEGRITGIQCVFWEVSTPMTGRLPGDWGDLVCTLDARGRFVEWNDPFLRFAGYTEPAMAKMTFLELVVPSQRPIFQRVFDLGARGHESSLSGWTVVRRDGKQVSVQLKAMPLVPSAQVRLTGSIVSDTEAPHLLSPTVFMAFQMQAENSVAFRDDLRDRLRHAVPPITLTYGDVDVGEWPPIIRQQIVDSQMVVGDITDLRSDVLFELGFAKGYGKKILPVVATRQARDRIPHWLDHLQWQVYESEPDRAQICAVITNQLKTHRTFPQAAVSADKLAAVWLRELDWTKDACQACDGLAIQSGLSFECVAEPEHRDDVAALVSQASLLIVSLDHKLVDALMHYLCGMVVARPSFAGANAQRAVIVVCKSMDAVPDLVAPSLRHCSPLVTCMTPDKLPAAVRQFIKAHRGRGGRA